MVWLGIVLFTAVAVAMLRGGRFTNLADIRLRLWWLLPIGFLLQAGTPFLPEDSSWGPTAGVVMVLASYVPLIVVVILNRERTGLWLTGVGILMNFTVIAVNGAMPVLSEAAHVAGGFVGEVGLRNNYKHVILDSSSRLVFLADVIPIRLFGQGTVISLGDVFLAVGLARFLEAELRKPVRWFKYGVTAKAGSAAGSR
jgi:hypothetical protein